MTNFRLSDCKDTNASENGYQIVCNLANVGLREGDEVIQIYHVAQNVGKVDHPLPKRSLIDFDRYRLPAGTSIDIMFGIPVDALKIVNENGVRILYPGEHKLVVSRGHPEDEISINVVIPARNIYYV